MKSTEQKKGLTFETECGSSGGGTEVDGSGTFARNGAQPPPAEAGTSGPPAKPLTPLVSGVHLVDRIGNPLRILKEAEWRCLHERGGLIELKFNRRGKLLHVKLQNGVAFAHITAALRIGMKDRIPVAVDSRTVEIEPGMRTTFRFTRIRAWSPEMRRDED